MKNSQAEHSLLAAAVQRLARCGDTEICLRNTLKRSMEKHDLDIPDVIRALRLCTGVREGFSGGCFVVGGRTVDEYNIEIAVRPDFERESLRLLKTWRA